MCKYIELTESRKKIIDQFKITDRDERVYDSLNKAIKDALERACKDINFRTLQEKSKYQELVEELCKNPTKIHDADSDDEKITILKLFEEEWKNEKNESEQKTTITNYLIARLEKAGFIQKFEDYFLEKSCFGKKKFDKWHNEACQIFLDILKKYYTDAKYGKAQKIVNMMFKHLYCMNFGKNKEKDKSDWRVLNKKYFKYCHLTLDSFTLEWFYREVVEKWYNKKDANTRGDQIHKGKFDSWSNLGYSISKNDYECYTKVKYKCKDEDNCRLIKTGDKYFYHYMFFVTVIREFFDTTPKATDEQMRYDGKTPFEAEFYIWPDIQLHLTAETLFAQSIGQEKTMEELERKTGQRFEDFSEAKKCYKALDRKVKAEILEEKIKYIKKLW